MVRQPSKDRRSEVVTVRLGPKLKYLAEIAGRAQRRTLSGFIEWAAQKSLRNVMLRTVDAGEISVADAERLHRLWDVDEPDRLVRLALYFPYLLTHEEQMIWKLVRETGYVWRGQFEGTPPEWRWQADEDSIIWDRLREHWKDFREVARGTKPVSELPQWQDHKKSLQER